MKKCIYLLLFLILIFSSNVAATEYGVNHEAGGNPALYDVRYRTASFNITLTANGETVGELTNLTLADLHFDGNSTRIWMTSEDLCSRLNIDANRWAQLKAANVYVYCAATIQIFNINNPSHTLDTIYRKEDVYAIAGPYNFMAVDYVHMRQRYGALNLFDTVPVIPVIPPNAGGGGNDPNSNHIELVAWLDYLDDIGDNDQKIEEDSTRTSIKIKSGYGIKVFAQLQGFHFRDYTECPIDSSIKSKVGSFYIDGITTTVEQSGFNDFVDYWYEHAVSGLRELYDWNWQGSNENYESGDFTLNYSLKENTFYPNGYRKIYTDPLTPNGYYVVYVKTVVDAHWTEVNIHGNCHYDEVTGDPVHVHKPPKDHNNKTYTGISNSLNIQIQESMFDDDQNVFVKPAN